MTLSLPDQPSSIAAVHRPSRATLTNIRLFLFDLDGVVYRGTEPIASAVAFLNALADRDISYAFLTNHAGRLPAEIAIKLGQMGVTATHRQVITSARAVAVALSAVPAARAFCLGKPALTQALQEASVQVAHQDITHVVVGYVDTVSNVELSEALYWLGQGAELWATNLDLTAPGSPHDHLECGAIAGLLEHLSGKACHYFGKPSADIYALALERFGVTSDRAIMVGDRLDTDIVGAHAAGLTSVLVLTGHTQAPPIDGPVMPDIVVSDLSALDASLKRRGVF